MDGDLPTNGCGRFEDVNERALEALRAMGVTRLWLTGCLRQATLTSYPEFGLPANDPDTVKGRAGSFYAVQDYFDVCPDYAVNPARRLEEFDALIGRIHGFGMKALIDFVPNHVARSYASTVRPDLDFGVHDDQALFFDAQNNFYYLVDPPNRGLILAHPAHWQPFDVKFDEAFGPEDGTLGHVPRATGDASRFNTTVAPGPDAWYETVKLNYGWNYVDGTKHFAPRPKTWNTMDEVLSYWQHRGIDGFRCDMAHMIPIEAWAFLIGKARSVERNPRAFFLAEGYFSADPASSADPVRSRGDLIDAGFDAVYHDDSRDALLSIYGGGTQDIYDAEMRALSNEERTCAAEYLENHDETRVAAPLAKRGFGTSAANYALAPLQFLYSNGPVILLNGQEVGTTGAGAEGFNGDDGKTTIYDYWRMPEFSGLVNGWVYNGGGLNSERSIYANILKDCLRCAKILRFGRTITGASSTSITPNGFPTGRERYTHSRVFEGSSGRILLVACNFRPGGSTQGRLRIPRELAEAAGLSGPLQAQQVLGGTRAQRSEFRSLSTGGLLQDGIEVTLEDQEACVYSIELNAASGSHQSA